MGDIGHSMRPNYQTGDGIRSCGNCLFSKPNDLNNGTVDCLKVHPDGAKFGDHPDAYNVCGWWKTREA